MAFRIYTKTGDKGETSLFGGKRLAKSHIRIESYGTVDELNAFLGLLRDHVEEQAVRDRLYNIQDRLFDIGAVLATVPGRELPSAGVEEEDLAALEKSIDEMNAHLPDLKHFILPGGHPTVSYCHVARCVCRRAERRVVALAQEEDVHPMIVQYLNRLSDYLFMLARHLSGELGVDEVIWRPRKNR